MEMEMEREVRLKPTVVLDSPTFLNHTLTFTRATEVVPVVPEPPWTGTGVTARCGYAGAIWATIWMIVNAHTTPHHTTHTHTQCL